MIPDLSVPAGRIVFGAEPLGGTDWGNVDLAVVRRAVQHAWERGVNAFDTADVYGLGRSERELAAALGPNRHEALIITKFGVAWDDTAPGRARTTYNSSPAHLRHALHASLRRLRLESIPLLLVHYHDGRTPLDDTIEELEQQRAAGLLQAWGFSNHSESLVRECARLPAAVQCEFSLVARGEQDLLKYAHGAGVSTLTYGGLARGLMSGKYGPNAEFPKSDRRSRLPGFSAEALSGHQPLLARLRAVADQAGCTPAQVALRWCLDRPFVDLVVVGFKDPTQVDEAIDACDIGIGVDDLPEQAFPGQS
jgi:aryl-alcohol dehydrogenase-like predicted oxidoreductase